VATTLKAYSSRKFRSACYCCPGFGDFVTIATVDMQESAKSKIWGRQAGSRLSWREKQIPEERRVSSRYTGRLRWHRCGKS